MNIETKFNIGEKVILIDNDKIVSLPVIDIEYTHKTIHYTFCSKKGLTMMDRDTIIYRDEEECFKNIMELVEFYQKELRNPQINSLS